MSEATCVVLSCGRETDRGYLCNGHFTHLGSMLRDIEDQAAMVDTRPSMAIRNGAGGGSLASQRSPARLDALVLRDRRTYPYAEPQAGPACIHCNHGTCKAIRSWRDAVNSQSTRSMSILETLHGWARIVREERALADAGAVTISGERDVLTRHLDWLADQEFIDDVYRDMRELLGQLRSVNGTSQVRQKPVGICPTLFEDGECGGKLWANEGRGDVVCDACSRIFAPAELRHLGEMLVNQGYVEVFRAEWFTGVPAGTIRRWVAEGRCTSEIDGRKLMVQIREIEELRDRRKRGSIGAAS